MESPFPVSDEQSESLGYDNMPLSNGYGVHPNRVQHHWNVSISEVDQEEHDRRINQDAMELIIANSTKYPPIDHNETAKLLQESREGNDDARDNLLLSFQRYVIWHAKQYFASARRLHVPYEDVVQMGYEGLITSEKSTDVEKYKDSEGAFRSYFAYGIRKKIIRNLPYEGSVISLPVHLHTAAKNIIFAESDLRQELMREPTLHEIAERCGMMSTRPPEARYQTGEDTDTFAEGPYSESRIDRALQMYHRQRDKAAEEVKTILQTTRHRHVSLEAITSKDGEEYLSLDETLPTERDQYDPVFEEVADKLDYEMVAQAMNGELNYREQRVMELRYGIGDDEPHTFDQVVRLMGVSRERIRQIQTKAEKKLRESDELENFLCTAPTPSAGRTTASYMDAISLEIAHDNRWKRRTRLREVEMKHERMEQYFGTPALEEQLLMDASRWDSQQKLDDPIEAVRRAHRQERLITRLGESDDTELDTVEAQDFMEEFYGLAAKGALNSVIPYNASLTDVWIHARNVLLKTARSITKESNSSKVNLADLYMQAIAIENLKVR